MIENLPAALNELSKLKKGIPTPVVNAMGQLVADQIDSWRARNLYRILQKAEGKLTLDVNGRVMINPKILLKITELGSLEEDDELQDMWSGLIASSIADDSNLHYVEIMGGLTQVQARVIKHVCSKAEVALDRMGLIYPSNKVQLPLEDLHAIARVNNIAVLDQALDDLRRKDLIDGGFIARSDNQMMDMTPSSLCLHFFAVVSAKTLEELYDLRPDGEVKQGIKPDLLS